MKKLILLFLILNFSLVLAQNKKDTANISQYYSGKFGFYSPRAELNNGILIGVDGITQFNKYNFFLSGDADLYYKKTFDFFIPPKPDISDQQLILIPLHVNFGYQLLDVEDADTKAYGGIGGGYYLYFYNINYRSTSGGLLGGLTTTNSESVNGGKPFFTIFMRALIGKIFIEPRLYIAAKTEGKVGDYNYVIDPSGFSITLGFQY